MRVNLQRDDSLGFAVNVAGDDGVGAGKVQFDARDVESIQRSVSFTHELISVVIIIRLQTRRINQSTMSSLHR